ncbi:hypothetical protein ACFSCX_03865 [Bacillus salitolerans]|uniref:Uncharacterized protein n=1 Tax=Bacillus salitolerans TaxID=1437434 RepID=A0ABW4LKM6_9BACI
MNLNSIWSSFLLELEQHIDIEKAEMRKFSGLPFLFIETRNDAIDIELIEQHIRLASAHAMKGKRLHSETVFVRKEAKQFVYRHRFFVPQEKMFCCGNLCEDCIRLKKK